jgi:hypothetical protein
MPNTLAIVMATAAGVAMMAIGGMSHVGAGTVSSSVPSVPSATSPNAMQTGTLTGAPRSPVSGSVTGGGGGAPLETLVRGLGGGGASTP